MRAERRKHPRTRAGGGFLITCVGAEFLGRASDHYNLATKLLDLSSRGLCLVSVGRLRPGLPVTVDVHVPGDGSRFRARAAVRWSETLEDKGRTAHVAGLEFDKVLEARGATFEFISGWMSHRAAAGTDAQRRSKRFIPRDAAVACFPRGFLRLLGVRSNAALALRNLSRAGAQIVSDRKLRRGQRVELRLEFRQPRATCEIRGVVRWCRRDTMSLKRRWHAGIEFGALLEDDLALLRALERIFI
jgi:hypothetical protein